MDSAGHSSGDRGAAPNCQRNVTAGENARGRPSARSAHLELLRRGRCRGKRHARANLLRGRREGAVDVPGALRRARLLQDGEVRRLIFHRGLGPDRRHPARSRCPTTSSSVPPLSGGAGMSRARPAGCLIFLRGPGRRRAGRSRRWRRGQRWRARCRRRPTATADVPACGAR